MGPNSPGASGRGSCSAGTACAYAWARRSGDERDAVLAFVVYLWFREHQEEHPAFEKEDCVFITGGWMRECLRAAGVRRHGVKAGYAARKHLIQSGLLVDTGRAKKPARSAQANARAEKFQKIGDRPAEGGRSAQPTRLRSYWWPTYRVPALARHVARLTLEALAPTTSLASVLRATARDQRSLSARGESQGLISRRRRRSRPNPGSVQWDFLDSGPP